MIIGLHGRKQSGKDTAGAYLVKHYNYERRAFADPIKQSLAALLDIPVARLERYKNEPTVKLEIMQYPGEHLTINKATIKSLSFREVMQRYGTESHRDVIDPDIWVDKTLPVEGYYTGAHLCITDLRFKNEAERIKVLGGHVVHIDRVAVEEDSHASEQLIPVHLIDYVLPNNGTLENLYVNIEVMISHLTR